MAKTGASLEWNGLDRTLGRAARELANRRAILDAVGETLVSSTIQRFRDGEGPDGEPWDASLRAKEEEGQTLVDTARLRNSIGHAVTDDVVLVGTAVEYAAIHQYGGKTGRGHAVTMPARPYLGLSQEDAKEVQSLLAQHLASAFRR